MKGQVCSEINIIKKEEHDNRTDQKGHYKLAESDPFDTIQPVSQFPQIEFATGGKCDQGQGNFIDEVKLFP